MRTLDSVALLPGAPSLPVGEDLAASSTRIQRGEVVAELRRRPQSRAVLGRTLGLSPSVISRLTHQLLDDGLLDEKRTRGSFRGRPPSILSVNPAAGVVVSILVSGGALATRVTDAAGAELCSLVSDSINGSFSIEQFIATVAGAVDSACRDQPILGIGAALPGITGTDGSVRSAPELSWSTPIPLRAALEDHFDAPVIVENDVNAMMFAEAIYGKAKDASEAAMLYLGRRGIGLGILSNGELLRGASNASGEVGQIRLDLRSDPGTTSSLEDSFSIDALVNTLAAKGVTSEDDPMEALLAHSDNPSVQVILKELRQAVSNTIGLISLVLDPEVLILGGALRTLYREGTADLDTQLATWIPSPPSVEVSDFGEQKMHWAIEAWCWNRIVVEGM